MNQISDMSAAIDVRIIEYLVQRFEVKPAKKLICNPRKRCLANAHPVDLYEDFHTGTIKISYASASFSSICLIALISLWL